MVWVQYHHRHLVGTIADVLCMVRESGFPVGAIVVQGRRCRGRIQLEPVAVIASCQSRGPLALPPLVGGQMSVAAAVLAEGAVGCHEGVSE